MGLNNRPATCVSCGKRLSRKTWYYRDGNYFCNKRCWRSGRDKLAKERKDAAAKNEQGSSAKAKEPDKIAKAEEAGAQEGKTKEPSEKKPEKKTEQDKQPQDKKQDKPKEAKPAESKKDPAQGVKDR